MKMTNTEVQNWCMDRVRMNHVIVFDHYTEHAAATKYRFENGETFETRNRDIDSHTIEVTHIINGEVVYKKLCKWHNFGWHEVA